MVISNRDKDLASGREEILDFCKKEFSIHSWQTIRYWKKEYMFPIRYLPNGKPFLVVSEAIIWAVKYDDLRKQK